MKNIWFISAFILSLAFVGISLERITVPNQEIIIKFADAHTTLNQTQEAIALVKGQLQTIDVNNIKIEELRNGALKVTYYSELDVSEIKTLFSKALHESISNTSPSTDKQNKKIPFEKEVEHYHLDIYKIQDSNDLDDTTGNIVESKSETTRSSKTKTYAAINKPSVQENNNTQKVAYKAYHNTTFAINNASCKIPETRAGPTT